MIPFIILIIDRHWINTNKNIPAICTLWYLNFPFTLQLVPNSKRPIDRYYRNDFEISNGNIHTVTCIYRVNLLDIFIFAFRRVCPLLERERPRIGQRKLSHGPGTILHESNRGFYTMHDQLSMSHEQASMMERNPTIIASNRIKWSKDR